MSFDPPLLRRATAADQDLLLGMTARLAAFPVPPWRTADEIAAADHPIVRRALKEPSPDTLIMVAEAPPGPPAGYIMVTTDTDYFTGERHGYVEILAVAETAVGRGLGRVLLQCAEDWGRQRGYTQIALNVFAANTNARGLYEHLGYQPETVRYRKSL
jgi:GNAT superfamily N-acetyltransferase